MMLAIELIELTVEALLDMSIQWRRCPADDGGPGQKLEGGQAGAMQPAMERKATCGRPPAPLFF
jgi:hypothetical protein